MGEGLRHMDWFDGLSFDALKTPVPTSGVVPRAASHAVARLKGAILQEVLATKAAGDQAGHLRAWKAITFLDRMLFAQARGKASQRQKGTKADVVTSRVKGLGEEIGAVSSLRQRVWPRATREAQGGSGGSDPG